ncbi:hypothetical protein D9619_011151 [Psilocybe cf. subviscida]|uniref:Uncharacterized protein n=1 Tax=Psilocybe cf. subviscida TaxID=2480587 RepID=A0A8H5F5E3_9AGAR|nr:hypothetical protein D9619_011151 [Psilocybe cf. subviscida]
MSCINQSLQGAQANAFKPSVFIVTAQVLAPCCASKEDACIRAGGSMIPYPPVTAITDSIVHPDSDDCDISVRFAIPTRHQQWQRRCQPPPLQTAAALFGSRSPTTLTAPAHPYKYIDCLSTSAVCIGNKPNAETRAVITRISFSTTRKLFTFWCRLGSFDLAWANVLRAALWSVLRSSIGYKYTCSDNLLGCTLDLFESSTSSKLPRKITQLQAQVQVCFLASLGPNAHIVSINSLFGGTF